MTHPRDLPQNYFELWQERAAIMGEATDDEDLWIANRAAFADILRVMQRDEDEGMRRTFGGK